MRLPVLEYTSSFGLNLAIWFMLGVTQYSHCGNRWWQWQGAPYRLKKTWNIIIHINSGIYIERKYFYMIAVLEHLEAMRGPW